jgi:hypothetical protein
LEDDEMMSPINDIIRIRDVWDSEYLIMKLFVLIKLVVFDSVKDRMIRNIMDGRVLYSSSFGLRDTTYMKIISIPPMKVRNINSVIQ